MPRKSDDKYKIAKVTWVDAEESGELGWNCLKETIRKAKTPCPVMISVGHVLFKDDKHISLVSTLGKEECGRLEKIPLSFVVSLEVMEVNKNAKI